VGILKNNLCKWLGQRPIEEITPPELLAVLRKTEARGTLETARRALQTAGQVYRYAIATGRTTGDPTPALKGALATPKGKHFAAITDPVELGKLLTAIDIYQGSPEVRAALQLSPLFFCRPGELRQLEWKEVNWKEERIEIAAEKMKMRQPHIIPLCRQSLAILHSLEPITGGGRYLFPSARGGSRPLSENGVRTALRAMGYSNDQVTPHGFRATARTLLDEVLGVRVDWIEHQLAHAVRDANGRAYNRTAHLEGRKKMMQDWADYLDSLKAMHP
jgi:integrase